MSWERNPLKPSNRGDRALQLLCRLLTGSELGALKPGILLLRDELAGIQWTEESCKGCGIPLRPLLAQP